MDATQRVRLPLTEAQEGLWYAQRLDPTNPIYNTGQYVELHGRLDRAALVRAIEQVMADAPALAMRFVVDASGPQQWSDPARRIGVTEVDLRDAHDPVAAAQVYMDNDMARARDPLVEPLVSEVLLILDEEYHFWYQCIHHLVVDGYGTALVTQRVAERYGVECGVAVDPPMAFGSFQAVCDADATYRESPRRAADRAYWSAALANGPATVGMVSGVASTAHTAIRARRPILPPVAEALRNLAASADVPWPDVIVSLAAAYVARHTGNADVILGVPHMARLGTPAARVPAMVMNVLPARLVVDEDQALSTLVAEHARVLRTGRRHGNYRGEQIRRDLGLLGGDRRLHGPLVNVLPFDETPRFAGLDATLYRLGTGPVDDFTIGVWGNPTGTALTLEIEANPKLYTEADVRAHAARFLVFVARAASASTLASVETLTVAEGERLLVAANATAHPVLDATLVYLIERTMRRVPDRVAFTDGRATLSYGELDIWSARLASALAAAGVARGDVVAVALPRSIELSVALVAILRAGAAYLPIDVALPDARRAAMLASAEPRCVIVDDGSASRFPHALAQVRMDAATAAPTAIDAPRPDDAAYVIYTSGSTGVPKGVVVEHRAIVNRLEWMRAHYGITAEDRILQKTPFTFDVSVWEFFLPFLVGATSVIAPPDAHRDPRALADLVRSERVTTMHFVPSMLEAFLAEPAARGLAMTRVFCSGEALPAHLRDRFHATMNAKLHNLYGPTEAAVDVSYWEAGPRDKSSPVPIGHPVWNTHLHVLDDRRRLVPTGVPGRLFIAGVQVARGYIGQPALTAERFVPNPFGAGRMYDTGDRVVRRTDGALVFLGRVDDQIKLRGQRIELGDVEAAILATGRVASTVVVPVERDGVIQALAAYVVPHSAIERFSITELRSEVERRVPSHMVPATFIPLAELPVTANGKLDRRALPLPTNAAVVTPTGPAPRTTTEQRIAELVREVLALPSDAFIASTDDFFRLGGHSLLAARLSLRVREAFDRDVPLGAIFVHSTIEQLAALVDRATVPRSADGLEVVVQLATGDVSRPPLFCIHPAGGISWCYGELARALAPRRATYGIQSRGLRVDAVLPATLNAMADDYIHAMQSVQPEGPYHLAGWSIGGIIAQAMGVQLRAAGHAVAPIALLDAYPSDRWRNADEAPADAALRALLLIAGFEASALEPSRVTPAGVIDFLRAAKHPLGSLSDDALHGVMRVVAHNNALVRAHDQQRFPGTLLHFRAARDHVGIDISPAEWLPYADDLRTYDVDVLHAHMTGSDAVRTIAAVLARQAYENDDSKQVERL